MNRLNREWNICTKTEESSGDCTDLNVGVDCSRRNHISKRSITDEDMIRHGRQVGLSSPDLNSANDAYSVEVSFAAEK